MDDAALPPPWSGQLIVEVLEARERGEYGADTDPRQQLLRACGRDPRVAARVATSLIFSDRVAPERRSGTGKREAAAPALIADVCEDLVGASAGSDGCRAAPSTVTVLAGEEGAREEATFAALLARPLLTAERALGTTEALRWLDVDAESALPDDCWCSAEGAQERQQQPQLCTSPPPLPCVTVRSLRDVWRARVEEREREPAMAPVRIAPRQPSPSPPPPPDVEETARASCSSSDGWSADSGAEATDAKSVPATGGDALAPPSVEVAPPKDVALVWTNGRMELREAPQARPKQAARRQKAAPGGGGRKRGGDGGDSTTAVTVEDAPAAKKAKTETTARSGGVAPVLPRQSLRDMIQAWDIPSGLRAALLIGLETPPSVDDTDGAATPHQ